MKYMLSSKRQIILLVPEKNYHFNPIFQIVKLKYFSSFFLLDFEPIFEKKNLLIRYCRPNFSNRLSTLVLCNVSTVLTLFTSIFKFTMRYSNNDKNIFYIIYIIINNETIFIYINYILLTCISMYVEQLSFNYIHYLIPHTSSKFCSHLPNLQLSHYFFLSLITFWSKRFPNQCQG